MNRIANALKEKTETYLEIYEELLAGKTNLAVVGLGYVGMPIAVHFAQKLNVIGFDNNAQKVELYKAGIDPTKEVGNKKIQESKIAFTSDETMLRQSKFLVVAVPTPVKEDSTPDLTPLIKATQMIGRNLAKGAIVVFESTVYPGATEEICIPILEEISGMVCGVDFKVGYSPERINPGDKVHTLINIKKIVSGIDTQSLDEIAEVYKLVVDAGVHKASCIKVAEAAKVVENSQRDINIAFMNELSQMFHYMDIDTKEVVDAMNTKWNALGFQPGIVGGHCISVDPYYLIHKAQEHGYHSQLLSSGRRINDSMGEFIAEATVRKLVMANKVVPQAKVAILGLTFKEDCPDTRNSKVFDIINVLKKYGIQPVIVDPQANVEEVKAVHGITLTALTDVQDMDCVIVAVPHKEFKSLDEKGMNRFFKAFINNSQKVLIDVKGMLNKSEFEDKGFSYWRL